MPISAHLLKRLLEGSDFDHIEDLLIQKCNDAKLADFFLHINQRGILIMNTVNQSFPYLDKNEQINQFISDLNLKAV